MSGPAPHWSPAALPGLLPADPRLQLVAAFACVAALSQLARLPAAACALAGVTGLALLAGGGRLPWRRLAHVEGFVALMLLTLPFTMPGAPVFRLGPLGASAEGMARAALLACKVSASALLLLTLLGGLDPARFGAALHGLRLPAPLVRLFALAPRYLTLLRDETERLQQAMRARGFRPGTSLHCWRSYGNLIGMVLLRALERARRIEEAMRCRGSTGRMAHAVLPRPGAADWLAVLLLGVLALLVLVFDRGGAVP